MHCCFYRQKYNSFFFFTNFANLSLSIVIKVIKCDSNVEVVMTNTEICLNMLLFPRIETKR